jgi:hypothetical protein
MGDQVAPEHLMSTVVPIRNPTPQEEIVVFRSLKVMDPSSRPQRKIDVQWLEEDEEDGEIYEELARRRVKAAKSGVTVTPEDVSIISKDPKKLFESKPSPIIGLKDDRTLGTKL